MLLLSYNQSNREEILRFSPEVIDSMYEQMKKNGYPVYRDENKNICIKTYNKRDLSFLTNPKSITLTYENKKD